MRRLCVRRSAPLAPISTSGRIVAGFYAAAFWCERLNILFEVCLGVSADDHP